MSPSNCASELMRLPGDYRTHAGCTTAVMIAELSQSDCRLGAGHDLPEPGSTGCLWIGAIGPIEGDVLRDEKAGVRIRFAASLDPAIIAHFEAA